MSSTFPNELNHRMNSTTDAPIKFKCTACAHENRVEKILNMRKDGKTGWAVCDCCKSYNNVRHLLSSESANSPM
jgi:hypothetical protein